MVPQIVRSKEPKGIVNCIYLVDHKSNHEYHNNFVYALTYKNNIQD